MTLPEFTNTVCPGASGYRLYDSCHDSPCRYSSHADGCRHPLHPKNQPGWVVPLAALHAIDSGFSGSEDEDTLVVSHDGEFVARYSRHASPVSLIADARQHMREHHDVTLPYSVHAVAGGA